MTKKKRLRHWIQYLLMTVAAVWLAGCTPAGPRALLRGKRLLDEGKTSEAIEELKVATSVLATNAQAWNYLGLAYHHAGKAAEAADAYQRALALNHDLLAVHYNYGCLLLEQDRPDTLEAAKNELTAFTVREGNVLNGWLKLGTAQLRLGEATAADASFREALRLSPGNAEALNDLGMVQLQRRRLRDAVTDFNSALKAQPNYGPALLNLGIAEIYLGNRALALEKYKQYLTQNAQAANWDSVNAAAQQLELELNPPPKPVATNVVAAINPATNNVVRPPATNVSNIIPPENLTAVTRPPATVAQNPRPSPPVQLNTKPEVVQLSEGPAIKTADANSAIATTNMDDDTAEPPAVVAKTKTEKRGFFSRLNPMGLFRHQSKPATASPAPPPSRTTPLPDESAPGNTTNTLAQNTTPTPAPVHAVTLARYPYLSPTKPEPGNRTEAERLLGKGGDAQRDHRLEDAVAWYRSATQADPSDFDAQVDLGLAALDSGGLAESLRAFELALAINPESFNARFYFGLALKKANYFYDAAQELEKLLANNSSQASPANLALAHLTLGNLYAEQFHKPAAARAHYLKVLELDPRNAQATAIRYWLQNNP